MCHVSSFQKDIMISFNMILEEDTVTSSTCKVKSILVTIRTNSKEAMSSLVYCHSTEPIKSCCWKHHKV